MNIYYVYAYLREDYTPYYIGKGKDDRLYSKRHSVNLPKDKSKIIIIRDNLSELQAFILERYYIRWFGRKDNETGILRNKTEGGIGGDTSMYVKNRKDQSGENNPFYGKNHREETRQYLSELQKGKPKPTRNKEYCENISKSKTGKVRIDSDKTVYVFRHKSGILFQGFALQWRSKYEPKVKVNRIKEGIMKNGYFRYKEWIVQPLE